MGVIVDLVEDVFDLVNDVVDWVVDEIVQPVVSGVNDVIDYVLDNPIEAIAKIGLTVVSGGAYAWAIPLVDGAATLAKGGDLGDALKAAAISYAGGKVGAVAGKYTSNIVGDYVGDSFGGQVLSAGITGGAKSATTALVYGQDPLQAFATGGIQGALGATLGQIDDMMEGQFENLQDGAKDSIIAGVSAALNDESISANTVGDLVKTYSGVGDFMTTFLEDNAGLSETAANVITTAVTNSVATALAGNPDLSGDQFFNALSSAGADALKDIVDRPVNNAIDSLSGAYGSTETAANALNEATTKAGTYADQYNTLVGELNGKIQEQDRLKTAYDLALDRYNANQTEANANDVNAAAGAFNEYALALEADYNDNYKEQIETAESNFNFWNDKVPDLEAEYNDAKDWMVTKSEDLADELKPVMSAADMAVALTLRPNFDEEAYSEFIGESVENVAQHFLINGQQGPASKSEADATLDAIRLSTVESALEAKGITLDSLAPEQLAKYLAYADKEIKNIRSITGLDLDKFANTMVADAALTPELTTALKDAGFIPQSTDDYNVFLAGEYIKLDATNADGSNIFVDTTGMTGDEVKSLLSANGYSTNNIVNVGDGFYNRPDSGASSDMAFDHASLSAVNAAVDDFTNNPPEPTLDTVSLGAGVDVNTLVNGNAVLVNTNGQLSWELPSTKQATLGETNLSSVVNYAGSNLDVVDIAFNALYEPLEFRKIPPGFSYLSDDGMTAYSADGSISVKNLPPASGVVVSTIAGLSDADGAAFDEATGGKLWQVYNKLKQVYLDETPEDQQEAFSNAASVVTNAGGEMLQAISGLATLVGANPDNSVGQTAKSLLALSGDLRSDAWVAGAEDMQRRSQDYDKEWRENNPGEEPTVAQKGWLKAQAIWGNLTEHPVQFLAENVASEILQEVPIFIASGGVGNVAKAALLQGGEAYAKKIGTRAALGTALTLDAAEAFGGTAASTFDETYANAIAATNEDGSRKFTEEEATELALDTAQKAGTIALFTTAVTAGVGGQALAKNILGDNASEFADTAFKQLGTKILDGTKVTLKEGSTEFVEEVLPQLYSATVNSQIDPSYDVAGSVFEAGYLGSIAGVGTASTIYSGNAVADALMTLNSDVVDTVKNAGSAEAATTALNNLGITDTTILNNVLNSTYDTMYVSTNEAAKLFKDANPEFEPTDAEIESFVSNNPESDVAASVAAYIDPRYLDAEEVKAAAAAEGVTLTDEQAEAYVGQKEESGAVEEIREEYDPQFTTAEEARAKFAELGFNPTDAQINEFVREGSETDTLGEIPAYVDPRQVTEEEARQFFADQGYEPTQDEINSYVGQGGADFEATAPDRVETYVDPRQVTSEEAREFFTNLGYEPTDEQVEEFVAQVSETTQADLIAQYVDPRQVTREELQVIADEEGLTLTDALAATYVSQGVAENYAEEKLSEARSEYDPLATTLEEATQFFANTGYTATPEEIAQFVASKTEETQTSAIGSYVDPRQVTAEEAEEFLTAIGYQPTQDEITSFVGQVNDENYQVAQKVAIDEYVDPRMFDASEVRAAYEELGLVDVTQEDVDRFVAQADPESEDYTGEGFETYQREQLETYMPTATFNVIGKVLGSPAVEDNPNTPEDESKDATGIYAEFEAGATRDEALQSAIDQLATDLGLSETEVLRQLGLTEERLGDEIDAVAEDVEAVKGEVTGLGGQITELGGQITGVEETLGADIDAISSIIGKPAQEVTQVDIDFVADVIAQNQVLDELQTAQYDVTGDGIVDINDQNLLTSALQGEDVTFADTSTFGPATGLYGTIADVQSDIDAQTDTVTDLITDLNTQINTETKRRNLADLTEMLMGAEDLGGQRVSVRTPDPMRINYLYDFNSIFANPSQASLFASPYGGTRAQPANTNVPLGAGLAGMNPMGVMGRAAGFSEGGAVDETDELLRLLGDVE